MFTLHAVHGWFMSYFEPGTQTLLRSRTWYGTIALHDRREHHYRIPLGDLRPREFPWAECMDIGPLRKNEPMPIRFVRISPITLGHASVSTEQEMHALLRRNFPRGERVSALRDECAPRSAKRVRFNE